MGLIIWRTHARVSAGERRRRRKAESMDGFDVRNATTTDRRRPTTELLGRAHYAAWAGRRELYMAMAMARPAAREAVVCEL